MITSTVKASVYDADGSIVYVAEGDVFYPVGEKKMKHVRKNQTFYHRGEIYTLTGDRHGMFLSEGATPDGRYMGTTPPDFTEVVVLEAADEISTSEKISCQACHKTFSMSTDGPRYAEKARQHISDRHIDSDGKPDRAVVDELLTRE